MSSNPNRETSSATKIRSLAKIRARNAANGGPNRVIAEYTETAPKWADGFINPDECSIIGGSKGEFLVMDWGLQTVVAQSATREGCVAYMHMINGRICPQCGVKRMVLGNQYYCPPCDDPHDGE